MIPNKTFIFKGSEHINFKNDLEVLDFNIIYRPEKIKVDIKELIGKSLINFKCKTLIFSKSSLVFSYIFVLLKRILYNISI